MYEQVGKVVKSKQAQVHPPPFDSFSYIYLELKKENREKNEEHILLFS